MACKAGGAKAVQMRKHTNSREPDGGAWVAHAPGHLREEEHPLRKGTVPRAVCAFAVGLAAAVFAVVALKFGPMSSGGASVGTDAASTAVLGSAAEAGSAEGSVAVGEKDEAGSSGSSSAPAAESAPATPAREAAPSADEAKAKLVLTEVYYADLRHGSKGAAHQKYIVLHDTEGGGTADGVLQYWESNGNLVAAHFVVNKDGSILQCVPLDNIAHHAGWGSGDANARFGISEDGRDDLRGRMPSSAYTDYGMNAWSIGIEMVHRGGETYPEAQLAAVDDLIAYIGNGGTIIDHKMWRAGNSDTNPEFATYLANYRDHRTHN